MWRLKFDIFKNPRIVEPAWYALIIKISCFLHKWRLFLHWLQVRISASINTKSSYLIYFQPFGRITPNL
jgi:hypothetical protein